MNKTAIITMCWSLFFRSEERPSDEKVIGDYIMDGRNKIVEVSKKVAAAFSEDTCYQCGTCCKEMPCQYGEWDEEAQQCRFLVIDRKTERYTTYLCGKYHVIKQTEQGKKYPMFGGGCYRPIFNNDRDRIIQDKNRRELLDD